MSYEYPQLSSFPPPMNAGSADGYGQPPPNYGPPQPMHGFAPPGPGSFGGYQQMYAPPQGHYPPPAGSADDLRTLFISGFPQDVKERELNNLLRFMPGYEVGPEKPRLGQLCWTGSTSLDA